MGVPVLKDAEDPFCKKDNFHVMTMILLQPHKNGGLYDKWC